jgi:hypothetical protein
LRDAAATAVKSTEGLVPRRPQAAEPRGASRWERLLEDSAFLRQYFWQYRRFMEPVGKRGGSLSAGQRQLG